MLTPEQENKRIAEGVVAFQSVHDKLVQSTNPSQKEKLEDALKKEIKKLQRSRDKVKGWIGSNDIKDKKPLMDQRKLIETVCWVVRERMRDVALTSSVANGDVQGSGERDEDESLLEGGAFGSDKAGSQGEGETGDMRVSGRHRG